MHREQHITQQYRKINVVMVRRLSVFFALSEYEQKAVSA